MELTGNHLQMFVTAMLVLGASAVALICDLLKSNNEHLREMNVELRVRCEEEQRRTQTLLQAAPALAAIAAAPEARIETRLTAAGAQPALDRASELATRRGARRPAEQFAVAEEIQPGASLAEARTLARQFMGRAAERASAGQPVETPVVATTAPTQPAHAAAQTPVETASVFKLSSTREPTSGPVTVEMVIESEAAAAPRQRMAELIPFETLQNQAGELAIPEGFHEGMTIARILNGQTTVRGLVTVIGINDLASRREAAGELGAEALVGSVTDHIRSILRPGDFACQSSQDEFLMICPAERDAAAQRRLGEIAESLWDFQLRTVGTSVILFSWGGVEAKGETFANIFAAARERMRETRRHRSLSLEAPSRRKAV